MNKEFIKKYNSEDKCLEYIRLERWPHGYQCPRCSGKNAWKLSDIKYKCRSCGYQSSITAGTIFHGTHLPLNTWFQAIYYIATCPRAVSALDLQAFLGIGSYRTAWTMLNRIRRIIPRDILKGTVIIDKGPLAILNSKNNPMAYYAMKIDSVAKGIKYAYVQIIQNDCSDTEFLTFLQKHIHSQSEIYINKRNIHFKKSSEYLCDDIDKIPTGAVNTISEYYSKYLFDKGNGLSNAENIFFYLNECNYEFNKRKKDIPTKFHEILQSAAQSTPIKDKDIIRL